MNESISKFLEKFASDEELQAKFSALTSPDEAFELAKSIQGGFTKEEFLEAVKSFSEMNDGDLSDEDLAATAGGGGISDQVESVKQSAEMQSVEIPRSSAESNVVSGLISGAISGVVSAVDDAAGGNPVSKYIKNSVKSATKAIKNALP